MTAFQLDDCLRDRDFLAGCLKDRHLALTRKFPDELSTTFAHKRKWQKDSHVLSVFLPGADPFVTSDKEIVRDNIHEWPDCHCGVIIVGDAKRRNTAGFRQFREAFLNFKKGFPGWHSAPWRSSIVRITQESVEVS